MDRTWQRDGWGELARIGILTPDTDVVPECEFAAMAPAGVSIHATRVRFRGRTGSRTLEEPVELGGVRAFAESPELEDAAERLAAAPLQVITYAFTSSSYLDGAADDTVLRARLAKRTRGIPVVTAAAAAVIALRTLGVRRVAVISPPWFSDDLNRRGGDFFRRHEFEVAVCGAAALDGGQLAVTPARVYDWVRRHVPREADGIFIAGNGFRAVGAIGALEAELGRPVVTANQGLFWCALRLGGVHARGGDYGRLFSCGLDDAMIQ